MSTLWRFFDENPSECYIHEPQRFSLLMLHGARCCGHVLFPMVLFEHRLPCGSVRALQRWYVFIMLVACSDLFSLIILSFRMARPYAPN